MLATPDGADAVDDRRALRRRGRARDAEARHSRRRLPGRRHPARPGAVGRRVDAPRRLGRRRREPERGRRARGARGVGLSRRGPSSCSRSTTATGTRISRISWHIWKAFFLCELVDEKQQPARRTRRWPRPSSRATSCPSSSLAARHARDSIDALLRAPRPPGMADGLRLTERDVWDALAEIPDPEIPVDLARRPRRRARRRGRGRHVHVEFTPTFLGCPALEVMRDAMAERIRELGAEPEIEVVLDDSWSTDRITPEGREKLREPGFAPPAPREAGGPQLVQLQSRRSRARTAARPTRGSRTSSARPRAARCATARAAASRSSSSRRSSPPGVMLRFMRKRFAGSYFGFSATSRS